jgi:hypothetical protein
VRVTNSIPRVFATLVKATLLATIMLALFIGCIGGA